MHVNFTKFKSNVKGTEAQSHPCYPHWTCIIDLDLSLRLSWVRTFSWLAIEENSWTWRKIWISDHFVKVRSSTVKTLSYLTEKTPFFLPLDESITLFYHSNPPCQEVKEAQPPNDLCIRKIVQKKRGGSTYASSLNLSINL